MPRDIPASTMKYAHTIQKVVIVGAFAALAFNAGIMLFQPSHAMTEDLGRHILLGEIIWKTNSIPPTNLFSYTYPDFPFVNHHWLSEVLLYLVSAGFGLTALIVLKVFILGGALIMAIWSGIRLGGTIPALATTTILLPLILERNSERPEMFAFFLFSVLFFVLFASRLSIKIKFAAAALIMILWVNLHISFIYGLLLVGVFFVKEITEGIFIKTHPSVGKEEAWKEKIFGALAVMGISAIATLLNPHGLTGALYPFTIFNNFAYQTTENLGVFQLLPILRSDVFIPYFLWCAPILALLVLWTLIKKRVWEWSYLIFLGFTTLVFMKIRNMPYFVFTGIPACSAALTVILKSALHKVEGLKTTIATSFIIAHIGFSFFLFSKIPPAIFIPEPGKNGLDFFIAHAPPGNIFNNFDIGSYIDYRLYPKYGSFVDNRPEAYPPGFFTAYIDMQINQEFREKMFTQYGINSVIFSRGDITDWAGMFLSQMQADPRWEISYLDDYLVIFFRKIHFQP